MAEVSDNIYIADLPEDVDDNFISQIFGNYGQVMSCKAMKSKFPGQKGAALVRYATSEEAAWVVENLNGNIAEGLAEPVKVRFANARGSGGGGGGGEYGKAPGAGGANRSSPWSGGGGGAAQAGQEEPSENIYIADLPENVDEQLVKNLFGGYGSVMSCKAMQSKYPGQKGAALVRFATVAEATQVVAYLNGNIPEGLQEPIKVRFANRGGGKAGGKGSGASGGGDASTFAFTSEGAGKGAGKGQGKPGTFSTADMQQVVRGLHGQLPGSGRQPPENCLYIGGLPSNTTDLDLYRLFAPFGAIPTNGVKAMTVAGGSCSGVGFVDFVDPACAQAAAAALNGLILPDGIPMQVRTKSAKNQNPPQAQMM